MWDFSSPFARNVRRIAGVFALFCLALVPFVTSGEASPSVVIENAGEALALLVRSEKEGLTKVEIIGAAPDYLNNTLIMREKPSGEGEIIGHMRVIDGVLYTSLPKPQGGWGEFRWYPAVTSLGDGMGLILGKDGMGDEVNQLREQIMPIAEREILTPMTNRLRTEFNNLVEETINNQGAEIDAIVGKLGQELSPEIEVLSNKLVETAWDKVGVWGVAEGLWRKGSSAIGSAAKSAWKGVKGLFGGEDEGSESESPDFLSDERKKELRIAMQADIDAFWAENGSEIMRKGRDVIQGQASFTESIEKLIVERFSKVVVETLDEKGHTLEPAVIAFTDNLGRRKLVTNSGAPRLKLAYAIRSGTGLTDHPLVIYIPPAQGASGQDQPQLRRLGAEAR